MGTLQDVVIGHRYVVKINKKKLTEGMAYDHTLS